MKQGGVLTRIGKGSVRGAAAEVPTEIGQQVIERAQAGLSLTSDEAISEYIDAGVAAGMIGSTVGAAGNIRATTPEMREEARRTAAQEKIARLETEVEPDPTDEILAIQGPPEMQGPPDRPTAYQRQALLLLYALIQRVKQKQAKSYLLNVMKA